jgi:hypothetical protein
VHKLIITRSRGIGRYLKETLFWLLLVVDERNRVFCWMRWLPTYQPRLYFRVEARVENWYAISTISEGKAFRGGIFISFYVSNDYFVG